jgi:hypothetical protein
MAYALASVVRIRLLEDDPHGAAQLAGVADRLLADAGVLLQTGEQALFDEAKHSARKLLGEDAYAVAHHEGESADLRAALIQSGVLEETPAPR